MLKAVDFFSGAGGMSCGFSLAGIEILGGIDIDPSVRDTYLTNHKNSFFINSDIKLIKPELLFNNYSIKKEDPNLIFIACSPCQHWTMIHTKKEASINTRNLLEDFTKFIKFFKPGYIVIENVPGIKRDIVSSGLDLFYKTLKYYKYSWDEKIIDTSNFGVPQSRKRFILIANSLGYKDIIFNNKKIKKLTVNDYIGKKAKLNPISAGETDIFDYLHRSAGLNEINLKRLRKTPKNGGIRISWKDDKNLQLETYIGKDNTFRTTYGRMAWGTQAPTITTKFYSLSNGRFGHPEQDRAISLREGALLQTFPRDYIFKGSSLEVIARQIGNAVPPLLAKYIAFEILKINSTNKNRFIL